MKRNETPIPFHGRAKHARMLNALLDEFRARTGALSFCSRPFSRITSASFGAPRCPAMPELPAMSVQKPSASTSKGLNTSRSAGRIVGLTKRWSARPSCALCRPMVPSSCMKSGMPQARPAERSCPFSEEGGRDERLWQRLSLDHAGCASVPAPCPRWLSARLQCRSRRASAAKSWISNTTEFAEGKTRRSASRIPPFISTRTR